MSRKPPSLRPTAEELLDAAREHLVDKVIPTITDARLRFQTLVAAHVLGVVSRELSGGSAPFRMIAGEVHALLGREGDDAAFCEAIREGSFDDPERAAALRAHLKTRVELELMAWNPLFLHRVKSSP